MSDYVSVRRFPPDSCESIAHYLRTVEVTCRPSHTYMVDRQRDVSAHMRAILVDWMQEVTQEFRLKPETFCLGVSFCDRYLTRVNVLRNKLQLVGVGCLLIAAKYEEIVPPTIEDFVYITDSTYPRNELARMELNVLQVLEFRLTVPTVCDFLTLFTRAACASAVTCVLAEFIAEVMQQDYSMLCFMPSMLAASAVVLALYTLRQPCWSDGLQRCTEYQPHELDGCLQAMVTAYHSAMASPQLKSVREKYAQPRFLRVSTTLTVPPTPPRFGTTAIAPLQSPPPVYLTAALLAPPPHAPQPPAAATATAAVAVASPLAASAPHLVHHHIAAQVASRP